MKTCRQGSSYQTANFSTYALLIYILQTIYIPPTIFRTECRSPPPRRGHSYAVIRRDHPQNVTKRWHDKMYIFRYIATFLPASRPLSTRSFMHPDREDMSVGYQKRLSHAIFIISGVFTYCSPRDKVHFWRLHSGKMNFSGVNEKSPPGMLPAYELDRNLETYPVGGFIIYFFSCIFIGLLRAPRRSNAAHGHRLHQTPP